MESNAENILIWLPSPMGDAILCTPALKAIRNHFASSRITFLAEKNVRQVLSPCPFNDEWLEIDKKTTEAGAVKIIAKAIAINLLNPKLTIFFFAFLPLFVSGNASAPTVEMMLLSAVFMGMTFIVFALYGILASGVRTYILNSSKTVKRVQRAFALVLAGFAVKLALSER